MKYGIRFGRKFPFLWFLPRYIAYNEDKTESYTLYNNGWVVIRGLEDGDNSTDMIPITMVGKKLAKELLDRKPDNERISEDI